MKNMQIVKRLEEYKLTSPNAETKTMPSNLRKEVRQYVDRYIGSFKSQVNIIQSLKKKDYYDIKFKKEELKIESKKEKLTKELNDKVKEVNQIYEKLKNNSLDIVNGYSLLQSIRKDYKLMLNNRDLIKSSDEEFKTKYGEGFKQFNDLLEQFEKKIEEALLFGTIVDVYQLIKGYEDFTPYLNKLSELKIK